jgi:cell division protein FtsL
MRRLARFSLEMILYMFILTVLLVAVLILLDHAK